jgi:hypothetical protein
MSHPTQGLRLHGDTVARAGQLDFAVNVVPGGPPAWLGEALRAGLSRAAAYPDEGPATTVVAARHGRPPEEVELLNGAAEAVWLLAQVPPATLTLGAQVVPEQQRRCSEKLRTRRTCTWVRRRRSVGALGSDGFVVDRNPRMG